MRIGEATNQTDLVAACDTARQRRLELRRGMESRWWDNIALVAGDHYAHWNPTLSRYEDRDPTWADDLTDKKPRLVINHALTVARTELSKLTKSDPIMEVIANSDEQADIAATKVGRAALDFAEWKFRLKKLRKDALWWMIQTGLGAVYIGYDWLDDKAGHFRYVLDPNTGDPVFDPAHLQALKEMVDKGELDALTEEYHPLGELSYKVFSPFQLLPDEVATDFEEIKNLITDEVADVDVILDMYGRRAKNVKPDSNLQLGVIEQRMMARAGVPGGVAERAAKVENGLNVHTFWLLPNVYRNNKFLQNGVMLRWCHGRTILEFSEAFPYQDSRMPFVFFQHIPSSVSIWPDSVMNHIRGPNLEIDKTVSQLVENKDYMANPSWLVATQHRIKGEVKNVAGAIIRYRHVPSVPPPTPIEGLQMPQQVENLLVGLRQQILDISGQSEVARGRVPTGVRSGVAVAYLQEEDDTKLGPTVHNMEDQIALMGSISLERFAQFYAIERVIRFYRRDGIFDARRFKGADLKNNTDVVCQAGSAMPRSKAARHQYTLELVQMGVLRDPHKIEQMLDLGQGEPDEVDKAVAQANRENNMMLHGVWADQASPSAGGSDVGESGPNTGGDAGFQKLSAAIPVKAWHNHMVHIARHTSVMMDEEFDRLSITRPEVVRLFDEHLAMHQNALIQQQQAQMQMTMAQRGAPDGPPTPPGGSAPGGASEPVAGEPTGGSGNGSVPQGAGLAP